MEVIILTELSHLETVRPLPEADDVADDRCGIAQGSVPTSTLAYVPGSVPGTRGANTRFPGGARISPGQCLRAGCQGDVACLHLIGSAGHTGPFTLGLPTEPRSGRHCPARPGSCPEGCGGLSALSTGYRLTHGPCSQVLSSRRNLVSAETEWNPEVARVSRETSSRRATESGPEFYFRRGPPQRALPAESVALVSGLSQRCRAMSPLESGPPKAQSSEPGAQLQAQAPSALTSPTPTRC